jgi:hypothetical protein
MAFLVLFALGLLAADIVSGASFPGPSRTAAEVADYVTANRTEVRWLAFFHGFAALALMLFAVHVGDAIGRALPEDRPRRVIAVVGGAVAGTFLLLDAVLFWLLALPATSNDPAVLGAVHAFSYLCGGVALILPLGAFIGVASWAALDAGYLPRWLAWIGVAATVEAVLYWATVTGERGAWSPSGVFVTLAVVPLLWIGAASVVLMRRAWRAPTTRRVGRMAQ